MSKITSSTGSYLPHATSFPTRGSGAAEASTSSSASTTGLPRRLALASTSRPQMPPPLVFPEIDLSLDTGNTKGKGKPLDPPTVRTTPGPHRALDWESENRIYNDAAKRDGILALKQHVGWSDAHNVLGRVGHKLADVFGTRTKQDKMRQFIEFVGNGDAAHPVSVQQDVGGGWRRHSRLCGERVATLDVKLDDKGIVDARSPAQFPAESMVGATWEHRLMLRSTPAERAQLEQSVKNLLVGLTGPDAMSFGKTAAQHANDVWAAGKKRAIQAGKTNPALARIPLEDRIAVAVFPRRLHEALNNALTSGNPLSRDAVVCARVLTSGLNQIPPEPDKPLFRGMRIDNDQERAQFLQQHAQGNVVTQPRFWTANQNREAGFLGLGQGFEDNILIRFEGSISAKPMGLLAPGSAAVKDSLYPAGTQYQVLQVMEKRDVHQHDKAIYELRVQDLGQT